LRTGQPDRPGGRANPQRKLLPDLAGGDLLYGRNAIAEALKGRRTVRQLFLADGIKQDDRTRAMVSGVKQRGGTAIVVPRHDLDNWTNHANHQGVGLIAGPYPYVEFDELLAAPETILALDHLQDPQNFGTLLRAADATGVSGVIIPRDRATEVTPSVVNASAGAVEHVRIAQVGNIARAIDYAKEAGWWSAALDTGSDAKDIYSTDLPSPLMIVVGAEGKGVSQNVRKHCDLVLSIPMSGKVASLNAATAGSIALFEIYRRSR
jgi:23S rRNA (guanosine2251-2'-O)-methyltransferase